MKRGDIVIVSAPGDFGKPRPAVVIQSDHLSKLSSVMVALITSDTRLDLECRLLIEPGTANGLRRSSQIMADKIYTFLREKCGEVIGALDEPAMAALEQKLAFSLGLVDSARE